MSANDPTRPSDVRGMQDDDATFAPVWKPTPFAQITARPWWCCWCGEAANEKTDRTIALCAGCGKRDSERRERARSQLHAQPAQGGGRKLDAGEPVAGQLGGRTIELHKRNSGGKVDRG